MNKFSCFFYHAIYLFIYFAVLHGIAGIGTTLLGHIGPFVHFSNKCAPEMLAAACFHTQLSIYQFVGARKILARFEHKFETSFDVLQ